MGTTGITIVNGRKITADASITLDQGINFGRGVFETIAVIGTLPVFLDKHLVRMRKGLAALGIANSGVSEEQVIGYIENYNICDCVLKILVTLENIVVSTRENIYSKENFKDGLKVCLSSLKRNPHSHVVYHKTINYTDNILEKETAAKAGFDEVIFTNVYNHLAEGSVSNVFFIKDNRLFTPATHCGLLNGIIRSWVIDNFNVEEGEYTLNQIIDADEVFLTNSLMGIMPVKQFQDRSFEGIGDKCSIIQRAYLQTITN